jgi:hypothetical protein
MPANIGVFYIDEYAAMTKSIKTKSPNLLTTTNAPVASLTKQQSHFKKLVAQIEAAETNLQTLAALMTQYRPLFETKLAPLRAECIALNIEMIDFLDGELDKKGWSRNQIETMREIICHLAEAQFEGEDSVKMEAMFDKHSDISAADLRAKEDAEAEHDLSKIFGVDAVNEDGQTRTTEELIEAALNAFEVENAREHAAMLENEAAESTKKRNKKNPRQLKSEQQALDTKSLIKDIYRKLSSAMHPDREPDEAERLRKTALMVEVNKAYESSNLLKLLQLQQSLSRVDQHAASLFADEKLALINRQLLTQYQDLQMEQHLLEDTLRMTFGLDSFGPITEKLLNKTLKTEARELRDALSIMRRDLNVIRRAGPPFKRWLKNQREMMDDGFEEADFDLELFDQALNEMFPNTRKK